MFVVRDLVVDMANFYAQYKSIEPYLQTADGSEVLKGTEYHQSKEDRAKARSVLSHTGPRTTALAWWTPILKDFRRRLSPPTTRFQSPPSAPFNAN